MSVEAPANPRWVVVLRALPLALGAVHVAFFVWVVAARFARPVELEWMSGAVWDHVERVRDGEPLYPPPSATFIPFLYPPLHYWLSALLAKVVPISTAARAVSVGATVVTACCVYRATKRSSGSRYAAALAVALFAGAYSVTGFWYDLDRSDSLFTALTAASLVLALEAKGTRGVAAAGALLGVAFLAKQPALVFVGVVTASFVAARTYRLAAAFLGGAAAVAAPIVAYLSITSGGWFWFYCIQGPAAHGVQASLVSVFFVLDAGKTFALFGASVLVVALVARAGRRLFEVERGALVLAAFVAAGFVSSASSRLHLGGFVNTLMFMTTFGAIAFGVLAARAGALRSSVLDGVVTAVALFQLVRFLYDPGEAVASAARVRADGALRERVRELEASGEVVVFGRSHLTAQRHLHVMALVDVLRAGHPIPADIARGLSERRYAAWVLDDTDDLSLAGPRARSPRELHRLLVRNYFFAERFDDRAPPPVIGWPARPSWVLRPRRSPLGDVPDEVLDRRVDIEKALCEARARLARADAELEALSDIEARAAALAAPR